MATADERFFAVLDDLVATSELVVDRPRGSVHPRHADVVYPLDYGFLRGSTGGDGDGVDVFAGTATGGGVVAVVLTADAGKRDVEVKIVLDCTPAEIAAVHEFLTTTLHIGGPVILRGRSARG